MAFFKDRFGTTYKKNKYSIIDYYIKYSSSDYCIRNVLAFLPKVKLLGLEPFTSQYYLKVPIQNLLCAQRKMTLCEKTGCCRLYSKLIFWKGMPPVFNLTV